MAQEGLRTELQALRALGVSFVVAAHLFPHAAPAGFAGLDVFFTASGFLITRNLLREARSNGAINLPEFWARRARRLLPGALLVLLAAVAYACASTPRTHWPRALDQVQASALYVQNWLMAADARDYWSPRRATGVTHYWSLSMEEQFYLLWPALIAAALWLWRRAGKAALTLRLFGLLAAVSTASLAYGLWLAARRPDASFFSTAARGWTFGAGGLLAVLMPEPRGSAGARAALSWAALTAIVGAAVWAPAAEVVPGPASLVRAAAAVAALAAGAPRHRLAPTALFELRPVQWLGELSYSVYLWHMPVLLLVESRIRPDSLGPGARAVFVAAVAAAVLLLSWLGKTFVEDPVRFHRGLRSRSPVWTYGLAAAATAVVWLAAALPQRSLAAERARSDAQERTLSQTPPPCLGAAAGDRRRPCRNPALDGLVCPRPVAAAPAEEPVIDVEDDELKDALTVDAPAGPGPGRAAVALIGDSHAGMLKPALLPAAEARGLGAYWLVGCAPRLSPVVPECAAWTREVLGWLEAHPEVTTVVLASKTRGAGTGSEGYERFWRAVPPSVRRILVVRDTPVSKDPDCVERALESGSSPAACVAPVEQALKADPAAAAARSGRVPRVSLVRFTRLLCRRDGCPDVIGGVLVRRDAHHLTRLFASTLAPYLGEALDEGAGLARGGARPARR
jgi:peptidoglycan/LPS O-acetylase OafA/YrhL